MCCFLLLPVSALNYGPITIFPYDYREGEKKKTYWIPLFIPTLRFVSLGKLYFFYFVAGRLL